MNIKKSVLTTIFIAGCLLSPVLVLANSPILLFTPWQDNYAGLTSILGSGSSGGTSTGQRWQYYVALCYPTINGMVVTRSHYDCKAGWQEFCTPGLCPNE